MVVTTVADCCSTLSRLPPAPMTLRVFCNSSRRPEAGHGLQLLLDERADFGGAPEPIGDRRRQQCKQADDDADEQERVASNGARTRGTPRSCIHLTEGQHDGGDGPRQQHRHDHGLRDIAAPQQRDDEEPDQRDLARARPASKVSANAEAPDLPLRAASVRADASRSGFPDFFVFSGAVPFSAVDGSLICVMGQCSGSGRPP
jgi:hypothetical protein